MDSLQIYVICGCWSSSRKNGWMFVGDDKKCGRLITLEPTSTRDDLRTMMLEDFEVSPSSADVEISYLPTGLIGNPMCPPIIISNDRQVKNLLTYLRKEPTVKLYVTFKTRVPIDLNKEPEELREGDKKEEKKQTVDHDILHGFEFGNGSSTKAAAVGSSETPSRRAEVGFKVKQEFSSKEELQRALEKCAMTYTFDYRVVKSCTKLWIIRCKDNLCNWRIRAECIAGSTYFTINKYVDKHTCAPSRKQTTSRVASAKTIGHLVSKNYEGVKEGPKPNDIISIMRKDHGAELSYSKAWRSRECATSLVRGIPEKSFGKIPRYLHMLKVANPGTHVNYECDGKDRFKYLFIAFGQSIRGFQKVMRKVITVDGTFLKGKYKGVLLIATAQDGNSNLYPIAFGVVDSENDPSWEWFFTQLKVVVEDEEGLTFVSDRHGSIVKSIGTIYPLAKHGICIHHLLNNVVTYFKAKNLASMVSKASKAYRVGDFEKKFKRISSINPLLGKYLVEADVKKWARCHFPGYRYNLETSNPAESINSALLSPREYPVIPLLCSIREMLTRWFYERRRKSAKHEHPLTEKVEQKIDRRIEKGKTYRVLPISETRFEVKGDEFDYVVDLERRTCSCRKYDLVKIPCRHAIKVGLSLGIQAYTLTDYFYTTEAWRLAYEESINPIEDPEEEWVLPADVEEEEILAPQTRRGPGRSRKRRFETVEDKIRSASHGTKRRRCSRCGTENHNRATCQMEI